MSLDIYFREHHNLILSALIDRQIISEVDKSSNEENIQVAKGFERALCSLDGWKSGDQKRFGVKHDMVFNGELVELKTKQCDLSEDYVRGDAVGRPKVVVIQWMKKQGNSGHDVIPALPHYLLLYQKYSVSRRLPACIGLLSRKRLAELYDADKFEFGQGDTCLRLDRDDCDCGYYIESKIPQVGNDFAKEIAELRRLSNMQLEMDTLACLARNKTGESMNTTKTRSDNDKAGMGRKKSRSATAFG